MSHVNVTPTYFELGKAIRHTSRLKTDQRNTRQKEKQTSDNGNRTRGCRVKDGDVSHYTISEAKMSHHVFFGNMNESQILGSIHRVFICSRSSTTVTTLLPAGSIRLCRELEARKSLAVTAIHDTVLWEGYMETVPESERDRSTIYRRGITPGLMRCYDADEHLQHGVRYRYNLIK